MKGYDVRQGVLVRGALERGGVLVEWGIEIRAKRPERSRVSSLWKINTRRVTID